jgi:hypothetical protein
VWRYRLSADSLPDKLIQINQVAIGFIIIFALVCLGWGRFAVQLCYGGTRVPWAFQTVLGLACFGFGGGLLNAFHIAGATALNLLGVAGVALSINFIIADARDKGGFLGLISFLRAASREKGGAAGWFPDLAAISITAFFAATILPAGAFNIFDDFHTYLVRPARMLGTGSVGGNPFDSIGLDSLGTPAIFQAFFLVWRPVCEINGFDAVFCFGACGCLIGGMARRLKLHPSVGVLGVLTFASINPQYVNISPIYAGSLMIGGLVVACYLALEPSPVPQGATSWLRWIPAGLIGATLAGLKLTFGFYAGVYCALFFGLLWMHKTHRADALKAAFVTSASALLANLPWIWVSVPTFLQARRLAAVFSAARTLESKYPSLAAHDIGQTFSSGNCFYGGNELNYTVIVVVLLLTGGLALHRCWREQNKAEAVLPILLASAAFSAVAAYLLNAHLFDFTTSLRYTCPILIAVVPFAALFCWAMLHKSEYEIEGGRLPDLVRSYPFWGIALAQIVVISMFLPVSSSRANRALRTGTLLSYPVPQRLLDHNAAIFTQDYGRTIREFQNIMEPRATLLAWTDEPFLFDYTRNRILTATEPGLINPLLHFPAGVPAELLADYFRSWGVRYILIETREYIKGTKALERMLNAPYPIYRKLADYSLYARRTVLELAESHRIVARHGDLTLFDLDHRDAPAGDAHLEPPNGVRRAMVGGRALMTQVIGPLHLACEGAK